MSVGSCEGLVCRFGCRDGGCLAAGEREGQLGQGHGADHWAVVDRCAGALRLKPDRGSLCEGTKGLLRGRGGGGEKCDLCVLDGVAVGRVEDEVGMVR